jgi:hypothetical protein
MRPGRSQVPNRLRVAGARQFLRPTLGLGGGVCPPWAARCGRWAHRMRRMQRIRRCCDLEQSKPSVSKPKPLPCPSLYRSSYSSLNPGSACLQGSDATSVLRRAAAGSGREAHVLLHRRNRRLFRVDLHAAPVADQTQRSGTPPHLPALLPRGAAHCFVQTSRPAGHRSRGPRRNLCNERLDGLARRNCRRPKLCVVLGRGVVLGLRPPSGAVVQHPCPCGSKLTHSNP